jgi:hypothetical protein
MPLTTKFENASHKVEHILLKLDQKNAQWAVPEMQRDFVWKNGQVTKLLSSMFLGFPVGAILYWENAHVPSHAIGSKKRNPAGKKYDVVIDGQQRLTALKIIFEGFEPERKKKPVSIRIQFNPLFGEGDDAPPFEIIGKGGEINPGWINVLEVVTEPDGKGQRTKRVNQMGMLREYCERHPKLTDEQIKLAETNLSRLLSLYAYEIPAVKLIECTTHAEAAEIFVRINSMGTKLDTADFIMTTLALNSLALKDSISAFARNAPDSRIYSPEPIDALTVLIAYTFGLPAGAPAYELLQGKTGKKGYDPKLKAANLKKLEANVPFVCSEDNWSEFLEAVASAGICSRKYLSSDAALLSSYAIFLFLASKKDLSKEYKKNAIGLWILFCILTKRYTSHTDTQTKNDLEAFNKLKTAREIIEKIHSIVDAKLPDEAAFGNYYKECDNILTICCAQQNITTLFSKGKSIRQAIENPGKSSSLEEHHIFPKNYMKKFFIEKKGLNKDQAEEAVKKHVDINDNLAPIAASENSKISDDSPADYVAKGTKPNKKGICKHQPIKDGFNDAEWSQMCENYALQENWWKLSFEDFIKKRSALMPKVIKKSFDALKTLKKS